MLCTHNSARSQMAEGWLRHYASQSDLDLEVWSAGTEATGVKPEAIEVMREAGIDISGHSSKSLSDLPDPWNFDLVFTVCDSAKEACPVYPAKTVRLHLPFADPSGEDLHRWREVRDALAKVSRQLIVEIAAGRIPSEAELRQATG